jgi:dTDP-4-dehydrorhamnose reductase
VRLLITGHDGQLARSIAERAAGREGIELLFVARPKADLEVPGTVGEAIRSARPDLVVNAAAFTEVDRAEDEPDLAYRINADAAGEAAEAAASVGCPIVQMSTDYVFDGRARRPYGETAATSPLNIYGASKLAGEAQVRAAAEHHLIVRTSWLFGPFGRNFVKTMIGLARERDEIHVVDDQRGSPTDTLALADAIFVAAKGLLAGPGPGRTLHIAGKDVCTWADVARQVMASIADAGGRGAKIVGIHSSDYPTKAQRPAYSALDSSEFERTFNFTFPDWRKSVDAVVRRLVAGA